MTVILPGLPYHKDALEPLISEKTLSFHYDKHHSGYVNKLNELLVKSEFSHGYGLIDIIQKSHGREGCEGIFNNAAQVWNHSFYWNSMCSPSHKPQPDDAFMKQVIRDFGSLDILKEQLGLAAISQFGSGWAWLVFDKFKNKLVILKTSNAETPLTVDGLSPLLVIDVWEHAYYLDYQNRRPDYVAAFLGQLLNWEFASTNYAASI
ncbi:superoxide dismutase [Neorickettsia risticii]|uniref:Superoxide dismutase n=1 Tax=Neorickettsia risticii (strain Illinois) TaxID=434131 RepID=C6V5W2_NEORI|nr:superoxide dismutase [Neorickettsia risticii]ACT69777.1 superoxide dismutase, Fe [Neorickettsia risticii str. Illinois]